MDTFIGIFDDARGAQRAMGMLHDSGLSLDEVSVISRASDHEVTVSSTEDVTASQGATVGAVWGGLVGLAALVIPGVGPFIAGGALATALAGAATGAVTGAVVGGVSAALIHFGSIPEEEAKQYESLVYSGKTLVAGKAHAEDMRHVRRILSKAGGDTLDSPAAATTVPAPASIPSVAVYNDQGQRRDHEVDEPTSGSVPVPPTL